MWEWSELYKQFTNVSLADFVEIDSSYEKGTGFIEDILLLHLPNQKLEQKADPEDI